VNARRPLLLLVAVVLLLLAAALAPEPEAAHQGVTAAVGRSMGGLRVLLVDILFLRADALRRSGQPDEAAALYESVLELDPNNDSASAYLVDVHLDGLLPLATTPGGRFAWWVSAWELAHRGLKLHGSSARLHSRVAQSLLDAPIAYPDLAARIRRRVPNPEARALGHLLEACRLTNNLPRLGRWHLRMLGTVALRLAVQQALEGDRQGHAASLAALDELLRLRRKTLDDMAYEIVRDGEVRSQVRLSEAYDFSRRVIAEIEAAKAAGNRAAGRGWVDAFQAQLGDSDLRDLLRRWVAKG
jgi:tetratricopeptide (TPR) repeat protein